MMKMGVSQLNKFSRGVLAVVEGVEHGRDGCYY